MRMNFGVTGINHEPLKVRGIDKPFKQSLPNSLVAPSAKAPVGVFPIAIIGRQITPWSAGAQNPQDGIDEEAIILR